MATEPAYRRKHDRVTPRGWFSLFLRLGGWSCLLAGAALLVLTVVSHVELRVADRFDADAGYAVATITGKGLIGDPDAPEARMIGLSYKTRAGGRTVEMAVDADFYDRARVGAEVPIRYAHADPARIVTEPEQSRIAGVVLRWIALAMGAAGLLALWRFGRAANAAILARRDGEKRLAQVVAIRPANVTVNDRRQGRLAWREEDGQTGESLMRDMAELERLYDPGDKIVVFRRGRDAFWEGDVGPPAREAGQT